MHSVHSAAQRPSHLVLLLDGHDLGQPRHLALLQTEQRQRRRQRSEPPLPATERSTRRAVAQHASQPRQPIEQPLPTPCSHSRLTIEYTPSTMITIFFQGRPVRGCPSAIAARSTLSRWLGSLWSNTLTRAPAGGAGCGGRAAAAVRHTPRHCRESTAALSNRRRMDAAAARTRAAHAGHDGRVIEGVGHDERAPARQQRDEGAVGGKAHAARDGILLALLEARVEGHREQVRAARCRRACAPWTQVHALSHSRRRRTSCAMVEAAG